MPARVIEVSGSTCVAGFVAGMPRTKTDLDSIKSTASSLDLARPRLTNSASRRVLINLPAVLDRCGSQNFFKIGPG